MIPDIKTPEPRRGEFASAFERGPRERPLRLLVDWETIPAGVAADVLHEMSAHPLIEVLGTRPSDDLHVEFVCHGDPRLPDSAHVTRRKSDGIAMFSLMDFGEHLRAAAPYFADDRDERRLLESRLTVLCERASIDALVTESPALLSHDPALFLFGRPNVLPAAEAVALAGLFLRSRGEFTRTPRVPWLINWKSAEAFYRTLAFVLIPSSRLWLGATLPRQARDIYDETFAVHAAIGQSITSQVTRALRARDHLQVLRRGDLSGDTAHDVAAQFEYALISLYGAFDSLAHLCAVTYGISKKLTDAWQREPWRKKLRKDPATLAVAEVAESKQVQLTLRLLGELRNTVHGPSLEPRLDESRGHRRAVVLVPPTRLRSFQAALSGWGAVEEGWWGVKYHRRGNGRIEEHPGMLFATFTSAPDDPVAEIDVDPGVCLERLLVFSLDAMERIAASIDWSRLGGSGFLPMRSVPPGDELVQERLRLLGGVWL